MGAASALLDADSGLCGPGLYGGDFYVAWYAILFNQQKFGGFNQHEFGS